jgi:hypothetical protein
MISTATALVVVMVGVLNVVAATVVVVVWMIVLVIVVVAAIVVTIHVVVDLVETVGRSDTSGGVSFAEGVLIVVHPNLENAFVDSDFVAEVVDNLLVPLLHLPSHSFRKLMHLILLVLAELGPEPLPRIGARGHHRPVLAVGIFLTR